MHTEETLARINAEWPSPLTNRERRAAAQEAAIQQLESRLGADVDRSDPMLGAMAQLEMSMMARTNKPLKMSLEDIRAMCVMPPVPPHLQVPPFELEEQLVCLTPYLEGNLPLPKRKPDPL
jgi:hypothetical protein